MENKIMIIDIPFNIADNPFWPGFKNLYPQAKNTSQTKEWIDYRIDIFNRYTLGSLKNQTNQNFKCVVRYSKESEELVLDALSRYEKLPSNIIFTIDGDNVIKDLIKDYEYIYHIRIDSDNMYEKNFIDALYKIPYYDGLKCILCQKGYIYEEANKRLASMIHGSPSFYALIYSVDSFLSGVRYNTDPDHWGAIKLEHKIIEEYSYMVIVHGKNVSNEFNAILNYKPLRAKTVEEEEKEAILKHFNII